MASTLLHLTLAYGRSAYVLAKYYLLSLKSWEIYEFDDNAVSSKEWFSRHLPHHRNMCNVKMVRLLIYIN